jgi:hypothetical protein
MRLFVGYLLIHNTAESGVALSSIIKTFGINYGDYGYVRTDAEPARGSSNPSH